MCSLGKEDLVEYFLVLMTFIKMLNDDTEKDGPGTTSCDTESIEHHNEDGNGGGCSGCGRDYMNSN